MQGMTDALFREFLSQPGERQWCSEILRSIVRGERMDSKDLLRLPSDTGPLRGSPRTSPVNSPRSNHTHLSPLLLPPSPRSPLSPIQPVASTGVSNLQPIVRNKATSTTLTPSTHTTSTTPVSITRSFCTTLANEVRPSSPSNGITRKIIRRRVSTGRY